MNTERVDDTEGYNDELKTNGEAGIRILLFCKFLWINSLTMQPLD